MGQMPMEGLEKFGEVVQNQFDFKSVGVADGFTLADDER